jgi:hypothetical protein
VFPLPVGFGTLQLLQDILVRWREMPATLPTLRISAGGVRILFYRPAGSWQSFAQPGSH